jgi:hypothetical protein
LLLEFNVFDLKPRRTGQASIGLGFDYRFDGIESLPKALSSDVGGVDDDLGLTQIVGRTIGLL